MYRPVELDAVIETLTKYAIAAGDVRLTKDISVVVSADKVVLARQIHVRVPVFIHSDSNAFALVSRSIPT